MATAIVLVQADRRFLGDLGERLADTEGVGEAYSVTGDWDFVAIVRVARHEQIAEVVTGRIARLEGVERTQTLIAFEAFSRHDLDALFDVGG